MKSRRLTETDLANMAFQPVAVKKLRLLSIVKPKPIPGSYEPFRSTIGDALNQQFPFLQEEREATGLDKLAEVVGRACKGDAQLLQMNLAVAEATHEFATTSGMTAEHAEVRSIALAFGHLYQFSMPLLVRYGGSAIAAFPDLRRSGALTEVGCHVVTSLMHQRWRVNYPDFATLGLHVWRYANNAARTIRVIECPETSLIPYDDLVADVAETYKILHMILKDQEEAKRASGEGHGPLFGT